MENTNSSFNNFFAHSLNPEQKKAAVHAQGTLVVRAGAGSGKTRVITARIMHLLLHENIPGTAIVALTFTNKAAQEMKERISRFLEETDFQHTLPYVGTFHAYCLRLLKSNPAFYDPQFSILDEADQASLIKKVLQAQGLEKKVTVRNVVYTFSQVKNGQSSEELERLRFENPMLYNLYSIYEKEKQACKALDFDDLMLEVLTLFKKNSEFKQAFQQRVRHILVDEYQDTNGVQHELLKQMSQNTPRSLAIDSVCVVGDEDQSIYSWRGAQVTNIINFAHDFPGAQFVTIEQNYRSVQPILAMANTVITHNSRRAPKKLWSSREADDRVRVIQCGSDHHEADVIAIALKMAVRKEHALENMALLYRSHYQSRVLEEALIRHSLPYKIVGGIQFYERQEIKDILAYLKLVVNPYDRISFLRIINTPKRGFGEKFQEQFIDYWQQHSMYDFKQVAQLILNQETLTKGQRLSLEAFIMLFDKLEKLTNPREIFDAIIYQIDYANHLRNSFEEDEAQSKIENVKELGNALAYFETQGIVTLSAFLDEVALMQEFIKDKNATQCVKLMTIHAAKGLEFDTVFLTGFEEGIFPSGHALHDADRVEEERRLLYVAITRARERLVISCARFRYIWGQLSTQLPSPFIKELSSEYMQEDDASHWPTAYTMSYFLQWFNVTN